MSKINIATPDEIRALAEQSAPSIDPVIIANYYGINVYECDYDETDNLTEDTISYINKDNEDDNIENEDSFYSIFINNKLKDDIDDNFKRILIAHQLGHIVLGHHLKTNEKYTDTIYSIDDIFYDENELLATRFAVDLLVPLEALKSYLFKTSKDIKFSSKEALENYFRVPYKYILFQKSHIQLSLNQSNVRM